MQKEEEMNMKSCALAGIKIEATPKTNEHGEKHSDHHLDYSLNTLKVNGRHASSPNAKTFNVDPDNKIAQSIPVASVPTSKYQSSIKNMCLLLSSI